MSFFNSICTVCGFQHDSTACPTGEPPASEIARLTKERDEARAKCAEEKKWAEELAKDICEMEDALGFKQDQTDKGGAFVPTKKLWLERVRDLIAKEGELGDLQAKCAEMREAMQFCNCGYLGGEHHPVCESQRDIKLEHALSGDCGRGWIPVTELGPLLDHLTYLCTYDDNHGITDALKRELERLEKLIKETK